MLILHKFLCWDKRTRDNVIRLLFQAKIGNIFAPHSGSGVLAQYVEVMCHLLALKRCRIVATVVVCAQLWIVQYTRTFFVSKIRMTLRKRQSSLMLFSYFNHQHSGDELGAQYESLKGQCHEICWHFLFHESKPSGPLINS